MLIPVLLLVGCSGKTSTIPISIVGDSGADSGEFDTAPDDSAPDDTYDTAGVSWAAPCDTWSEAVQTGSVVSADLDEVSGIAVSRRDADVLWVLEDHLGAAAVYALDSAGNTLATITLEGAINNDWEDIAVGACDDDWCIYIGEIGNNDFDRTEMGVYRLVEPDLSEITGAAASVSDWTWLGLTYPGSTENAEALAITSAGLPVVLSKEFEAIASDVYLYPALEAAADVTLGLMGSITIGVEGGTVAADVTAADLWPDDSRLLVRTYGRIYEVDLSGGLESVGTSVVTQVEGASEMHGEAVAYDPWRGGIWQVPEGLNAPISFTGCGQ